MNAASSLAGAMAFHALMAVVGSGVSVREGAQRLWHVMNFSVVNTTRYAVATAVLQGEDARLYVCAMVKSTWQPAPGEEDTPRSVLAEPQREVRLAEQVDEETALIWPSDVALSKAACDVFVVGRARRSSRSKLRVAVSIGDYEVAVRVGRDAAASPAVEDTGDQKEEDDAVWVPMSPTADTNNEGPPLAKMDWDGPTPERGASAPATLGWLPSHDARRTALYGACDEVWQQARMPLTPQDYDRRFANLAHPALQWPLAPAAGTELSVEGMSASGLWRIVMPAASVKLSGHYSDGQCIEKVATIDTVLLAPGADALGVMEVASRAAFRLHRDGAALMRLEANDGG